MRALRWLGVSLAVGIAAAAFTSCKGSTAGTTSGVGGSDGGTTIATGTGGTGGTGGAEVDAGPIVCHTTYTNIKTGPCDLIDQNCPPGKTCSPTQVGTVVTTSCIASSGLKTAGEPCYSGSECDAKLTCIGQDATHPGACVAFCCNDTSNRPCAGGFCNEKVDFGAGNYAYMCSYGQVCQLLTSDACPAGFDCHVEQGVAVCLAPSPTPVGELGACQYINDCASMVDCFQPAGLTGGVCLYYCALMGPNTGAAPGLGGCPPGETCQSDYNGSSVDTGAMGVGLCIPNGGIVQPDAGTGDAGTDAGDAGTDADSDAGDAGGGDAGHGDAGDAGDGG